MASYRGQAGQQGQFQALVVPSDTVYYRFTSGAGSTFWGYRFTVAPIDLRLNDRQVWFYNLSQQRHNSFRKKKKMYMMAVHSLVVRVLIFFRFRRWMGKTSSSATG